MPTTTTTDKIGAKELRRQCDYLLNEMRRIAASDPNHSQFAALILAAAREAVEFVDERLL
jgi:hypothetical protein